MEYDDLPDPFKTMLADKFEQVMREQLASRIAHSGHAC
jgi:hypothetical protein